MKSAARNPFPDKWEATTLGIVCSLVNGDRGKNYPGRKSLSAEGVPFVNAGDLQHGSITSDQLGFISSEVFERLRSGKFVPNDILYCIRGSLGKVAINLNLTSGAIASSLIIIRPKPEVVPKYVLYYLMSPLASSMIAKFDNGTAQPNLSGADLAKFEIPLPPHAEQQRIVSKMEELLSEVESGLESLKAAQKQVRAYRQAVLGFAFEGRLTENWRAENPGSLQSRLEFEGALRKLQVNQRARDQASGFTKKADHATDVDGAVRIPVEKFAELAALPKGWHYISIASLCSVVRGGSPRPAGDPKYYDGAIPFLKVADLTGSDGPRLDTHTFTIKEAGLSKTRMTAPDTLLISNSGATLGVPKICTFKTTFNDGIAAFLGLPKEYLEFAYYFWESKTIALRAVNQGAAQPNLNTSILGDMAIPMCSKEEAKEVVRTLEAILSAAELLSSELEKRILEAAALKQAVLRRAFSGQLVEQSADDESAAALLARIEISSKKKDAA